MMDSRHRVQSNADEACIVCFRKHKKCDRIDGLCCATCSRVLLKARPTKAMLRSCNDNFKSSVGRNSQSHAATLNPWLANPNRSVYTLTFHFESDSKLGKVDKSCDVKVAGPFCVTNIILVNQLNDLFRKIWNLEIEANDDASEATHLVRVCISYINIAFRTRFTSKSITPQELQALSTVIDEFVLLRINELIVKISDVVPNKSGETDANLRPGLETLYLFLPAVNFFLSKVSRKVSRLGYSNIYNDIKLVNTFKKLCGHLDNWVEAYLQMDFETEISWGDWLTGSKTDFLRKLRIMAPLTLALDIVYEGGSPGNTTSLHSTRSESASYSPSSIGESRFDTIFGGPLGIVVSSPNHLPDPAWSILPKLSFDSPDNRTHDSLQQPLTHDVNFDMAQSYQSIFPFDTNGIGFSDPDIAPLGGFDDYTPPNFPKNCFSTAAAQANAFCDPPPSFSLGVYDSFGKKLPDINLTHSVVALPQNGFNGVDESNNQLFSSFQENHSHANAEPGLVLWPVVDSEKGNPTLPSIGVPSYPFEESADNFTGLVDTSAQYMAYNMISSNNMENTTQPYTQQDDARRYWIR